MKTFSELAYAQLQFVLENATVELGKQTPAPGKDRRTFVVVEIRALPLDLKTHYALSTTVAAHMRAWGIGTRVQYTDAGDEAAYEIHLFMEGK